MYLCRRKLNGAMRRNDFSNKIIGWGIIIGDFILLNIIIWAFAKWHWRMATWQEGRIEAFTLVCNVTLLLSQLVLPVSVHLRVIGVGDVLRRMSQLVAFQSVVAYILLRHFVYNVNVGWLLLEIGIVFWVTLVILRIAERKLIKVFRIVGRNSRSVMFVGTDPEQTKLYHMLMRNKSFGYRVVGFYGEELEGETRLGSMDDLLNDLKQQEKLPQCDELYVCVSRLDKQLIRDLSDYCDHHVIKFFYVPVSVETIGLNLRAELMEDMEVYTTFESPLENPMNKALKRVFDIVMALIFLIPTALVFPIVYIIMKIQSPGPILFKQERTGLDGKTFKCYKFRSMHVNDDADKVQATKDDPRKYPFGDFMRKTNIDELPQFYNVLQGRMSIVGPRPHMLAHTEQYSALIGKYMVRHFVKPGITGWAQVTGYRGETKELWQMEGRVKRDIWYMEHWSIWLDIRIIWLTIKKMIIRDKNAY